MKRLIELNLALAVALAALSGCPKDNALAAYLSVHGVSDQPTPAGGSTLLVLQQSGGQRIRISVTGGLMISSTTGTDKPVASACIPAPPDDVLLHFTVRPEKDAECTLYADLFANATDDCQGGELLANEVIRLSGESPASGAGGTTTGTSTPTATTSTSSSTTGASGSSTSNTSTSTSAAGGAGGKGGV